MEHHLWFMLQGAIAGWLAGVFTRGDGFGLLGNVLFGAAGSFIGAWLFGAVGLSAYGFGGAVLMSFAGTVALITLVRSMGKA